MPTNDRHWLGVAHRPSMIALHRSAMPAMSRSGTPRPSKSRPVDQRPAASTVGKKSTTGHHCPILFVPSTGFTALVDIRPDEYVGIDLGGGFIQDSFTIPSTSSSPPSSGSSAASMRPDEKALIAAPASALEAEAGPACRVCPGRCVIRSPRRGDALDEKLQWEPHGPDPW